VAVGGVFGCALVLVDQAAEDGLASDLPVVKVRAGMIWARREKAQRSMWSPTVVVGAAAGEDRP
jgi:hypothetical protein